MTLEEKQKELDLSKWNKSQSLRLDACGTFNYCANCNKTLKNPCAHAFGKYFNEKFKGAEVEEIVEVVEPKKETTKKTTTTKTCKSKSTTKTPSKKTTTKSTTKKTTKSTK